MLDLNVDYAGRDNARDMAEIVRRVVRQVDAPLMIDSTQIATIEAGLQARARASASSTPPTSRTARRSSTRSCRLRRTYGAALVIGSIDEDKQASMARTAERKLSIADARAFKRATDRFGIDPGRRASSTRWCCRFRRAWRRDRRSALETDRGRQADQPPRSRRARSIVGLSNVSFGLNPPPASVLNSAFLHELRDAGLDRRHRARQQDSAREQDRPPHQWAAALDLIYDRRGDAQPTARGCRSRPAPGSSSTLFNEDAPTPPSGQKKRSHRRSKSASQAHIIDGEKQSLNESASKLRPKYRRWRSSTTTCSTA